MENVSKNLAIALKLREKELKKTITYTALAKQAGTTLANMSRMFKGPNKQVTHKLETVAEILGVTMDWLINYQEDADGSNVIRLRTVDDIPIDKRPVVDLAKLYASRIGNLDIRSAIENNVLQHFDVSPHLRNYLHVFGGLIQNNDLEPRYYKGEAVVVAPLQPVVIGDYVFVSIKDAEMSYVSGKLVSSDDENLVIAVYNGREIKQISYEKSNTIDIHKILNNNLLLNF